MDALRDQEKRQNGLKQGTSMFWSPEILLGCLNFQSNYFLLIYLKTPKSEMLLPSCRPGELTKSSSAWVSISSSIGAVLYH